MTTAPTTPHSTGVDPELIAYLDRSFGDLDRRFDELRRHFDVVAESLMSKIALVGEGVRTVDQKLDRFAGEVSVRFEAVDRRFLYLTASLTTRRRS